MTLLALVSSPAQRRGAAEADPSQRAAHLCGDVRSVLGDEGRRVAFDNRCNAQAKSVSAAGLGVWRGLGF